jgi:hypothetical protein
LSPIPAPFSAILTAANQRYHNCSQEEHGSQTRFVVLPISRFVLFVTVANSIRRNAILEPDSPAVTNPHVRVGG